jgi:rod shape-determining protein MreC
VARVTQVERRAESAFARVLCTPIAQINSATHVLVLAPVGTQLPASPLTPEPSPTPGRRPHPRER